MTRPAVEVADILHAQGDTFVEQHPWLSVQQRSVLCAIARCRTAALGGHLDRCDACGHQAISYNSCRNRHCPKCQAQARERWLHARERELLDVPYVHVVFTLPHALLPLAYRNSARLDAWLFQTSAMTLREVAADPRHLGAELGVLSILHTWGQTLVRHPHVHCVVPAGGLSPDHQRWIHPKYAGFFLPVKVLSRVFRGKFVEALRRALRPERTRPRGRPRAPARPGAVARLRRCALRDRLGGLCQAGLRGRVSRPAYLGRYTHRVAISNHRLLAFDGDHVTFQWKDYAHGDQRRTMTLSAMEFLRRFVQHILPRGFVRSGSQAFSRTPVAGPASRSRGPCSRHRRRRHLTDATPTVTAETAPRATWACPRCGAAMIVGPILSALHLATVTSASTPHEHQAPSEPASSSTWSPTCREGVRHLDRALTRARRSARPRHAPAAAAVARAPPALSIRHSPAPGDPDSSSIAGRRASGFLQVSLSKVPRHLHRGARPASCAETPPMNASDYSGVIAKGN